MSKGNTFENDLLKLIFNAVSITSLARDAASPIAVLYVSLHTSSPGEGGDQTTNEIAYTGYARVSVARTSGGWTVTGASVSPVANINFGEMTAGAGGTVTHVGIGTVVSGAGKLLYYGAVSPTIAVVNTVVPRLTTDSVVTED